MPFVTERIWQELKKIIPSEFSESIMIAKFPSPHGFSNPELEKKMDKLTKIVSGIRLARHDLGIKREESILVKILTDDQDLEHHLELIKTMVKVDPLLIEEKRSPLPQEVRIPVAPDTDILVPQLIDRERISREEKQISERISQIEERLRDDLFVSKAPPEVVKREEEKLERFKSKLEVLRANLTTS
jgi:valyl-tRNA synthetase